jgi:hypothetical protein
MASKIITGGNCLITHGTTIGSSFRSDIVNMERGKTVSFQIKNVGASTTGTLQFDVANDPEDNVWVPVTLASGLTTVTISGATNTFVDLEPIGAKYISVYWTDSGSDTNGDDYMTIKAHVKDQ